MNFEQAKELSFLVPWKVAECFSGPQCWCRKIVPVDPISYNNEVENLGKTLVSTETEDYEIIPDASIDQKTAEYIVKLHNEYHERMKETMDSIVDSQLTKEQKQKENFLKLWDQLNVGPRTIEIKEID